MSDDFTLEEEMEDLVSAEDFLEFFDVEYDQKVVHVNRLHILQRFHDYNKQSDVLMLDDDSQKRDVYTEHLKKAYHDFVVSDSYTEKVFKVFHMHEPQSTFVSLDNLIK